MDERRMKTTRARAKSVGAAGPDSGGQNSAQRCEGAHRRDCSGGVWDGSGETASDGPRFRVSRTGWKNAAAALSLWVVLAVGFVGTVGWSAPGKGLGDARRPRATAGAEGRPLTQPAAEPATCDDMGADCPCRSA